MTRLTEVISLGNYPEEIREVVDNDNLGQTQAYPVYLFDNHRRLPLDQVNFLYL